MDCVVCVFLWLVEHYPSFASRLARWYRLLKNERPSAAQFLLSNTERERFVAARLKVWEESYRRWNACPSSGPERREFEARLTGQLKRKRTELEREWNRRRG